MRSPSRCHFVVLAAVSVWIWTGTLATPAQAGDTRFRVHVGASGHGSSFHLSAGRGHSSHSSHRRHYSHRYHHGGHHYRGHVYHSPRPTYYYPHVYTYPTQRYTSYSYTPARTYCETPTAYTYYRTQQPTTVAQSKPDPSAVVPATRYEAPTQPVPVPEPTPVAVPIDSEGEGWSHLTAGEYNDALRYFGAQSEANGDRGGPKVGYSLASAFVGDFGRSVWAMRRAFRTDAHGVHYVRIDEQLRDRMLKLIAQFEHADGLQLTRADSAFMVSALHFLQRDIESARVAIAKALAAGDNKSSTLNLQGLIEDEDQPTPVATEVPVSE